MSLNKLRAAIGLDADIPYDTELALIQLQGQMARLAAIFEEAAEAQYPGASALVETLLQREAELEAQIAIERVFGKAGAA